MRPTAISTPIEANRRRMMKAIIEEQPLRSSRIASALRPEGSFAGTGSARPGYHPPASASIHLHPGKDIEIVGALDDVHLLRHAPGQRLLMQRDEAHIVE